MALFVPADESQKLSGVKPENGTDFQLEELYRLLDCTCIELVEAFNGDLIVCDEEAKLTGKLMNRRATEMAPFVTVGELKQMLAASGAAFIGFDEGRNSLARAAAWVRIPTSDQAAGDRRASARPKSITWCFRQPTNRPPM